MEWVSQLAKMKPEHVRMIIEHKIDGAALLRLTRQDLQTLGFKFGPASKLSAAIAKLQNRSESTKFLNFIFYSNACQVASYRCANFYIQKQVLFLKEKHQQRIIKEVHHFKFHYCCFMLVHIMFCARLLLTK